MRLMLTIRGGLAEFERELIRSRTEEGRKRAQDRSVRFGRKPALTSHSRGEALVEIARSYNVFPQHHQSACGGDLLKSPNHIEPGRHSYQNVRQALTSSTKGSKLDEAPVPSCSLRSQLAQAMARPRWRLMPLSVAQQRQPMTVTGEPWPVVRPLAVSTSRSGHPGTPGHRDAPTACVD
jgi:hypothetical protein